MGYEKTKRYIIGEIMKVGKVWDQTELLEANGVLEFYRIAAKAGGVCSKHKH